jgi:ABC-type Na+ efflux pump permease subunit
MRYSTYDRTSYAPAYGSGIAVAIYFVLGLLVAVANNYFDHLTTFGRLLSALLAVLLWPLLLLGIDIRIR